MLPCFWKKNTGIDCFGCGMQRSVALISQGKFIDAFYMYPAIYSLILMFIFLVVHIFFKIKNGHKILIYLFIVNICIIVINFFLKIF